MPALSASRPEDGAGVIAKNQPVSAEIVWRHNHIADENTEGDVRVTLANGAREIWTRKGRCVLPRVSKSGLVGWTHGTGYHPRQGLLNHTLVIARADKVLARIDGAAHPFINLWDFDDHDRTVVILSRGPHGSAMIEKFRIQDGKFLGEAFEGRPEEQPEWAKRFLQKGYVEGTYVQ